MNGFLVESNKINFASYYRKFNSRKKFLYIYKKGIDAPAGNRTRVCTVAGYYSTTRPLVPVDIAYQIKEFYSRFWSLKSQICLNLYHTFQPCCCRLCCVYFAVKAEAERVGVGAGNGDFFNKDFNFSPTHSFSTFFYLIKHRWIFEEEKVAFFLCSLPTQSY